MRPFKRVIFEELVGIVKESECGNADLSIWGGHCAQNDLKEFLLQWDIAQMPYRIWEYASEIAFEENTPLQNEALLERARLFGLGGDLELRRDGATFMWRFVGPAGKHPLKGDYSAHDYWESHSEVVFHQSEEKALLWGQWSAEKCNWTDDRVGAALLHYPVPTNPVPTNWQRVQVRYKAFSCAGHVEFVWFTGLSEYKEDNNG